jgi:hypothetical protein
MQGQNLQLDARTKFTTSYKRQKIQPAARQIYNQLQDKIYTVQRQNIRQAAKQCCGTVTIYYGSGSDF